MHCTQVLKYELEKTTLSSASLQLLEAFTFIAERGYYILHII